VPRQGVVSSVTARKFLVGHINRQERKTFLSHFSYNSQETKIAVESLRAGTYNDMAERESIQVSVVGSMLQITVLLLETTLDEL